MKKYRYLGDRLTDPLLKNTTCIAVYNKDGKCICGRNTTMLVQFDDGKKHVVLRRLLRIIKM